jgi:hypothetical protein
MDAIYTTGRIFTYPFEGYTTLITSKKFYNIGHMLNRLAGDKHNLFARSLSNEGIKV